MRGCFVRLSVVLLLVVACGLRAASRPNIVMINAEDIGPAWGCYGDDYAITPRIDALARGGLTYRNAFATAPICSPSRACLATGLYATSLGAQHLRCEIELPAFIKPLPFYLREAGYFCSNTGKSDYNFSPDGVWDEWTSKPGPWRKRRAGQPFFSFITIGTTHEGPTNKRDRYEQAVAKLDPDHFHDPAKAKLPPYYPDTPAMREIWANLYNLISRFDAQVGEVLDALAEDGLMDDTFVVVFADHGHGLPRSKRWLYDSGLRVPLVVYVPRNFRSLAEVAPGAEVERMVSFVDFPATVLSLAGIDVPAHMQGIPFLGAATGDPRRYIYGARDRADDMFELSRLVHDGRYVYVRHFLPHLPPIQPGKIYSSEEKSSYAALRAARDAGLLNAAQERLFASAKPIEELYDLRHDPHEIENLADRGELRPVLNRMRSELRNWVMRTHDTGFLQEAEYTRRAREAGLSIYEMARDPGRYDLARVYAAADRVGRDKGPEFSLGSDDSAIRYWQVIAARAVAGGLTDLPAREESPSAAIATAEYQALKGANAAVKTLADYLRHPEPRVQLEAARALQLIGKKASPVVPLMRDYIVKNSRVQGGRRKYKDFNYTSFTGWTLEWALKNCGVDPDQL